MTRWWLCLLALGTLSAVAVGAQTPVFRSGVSVVRVDVLATDGGRPLEGLTAADFELTDNGVPQDVTSAQGDVEPLDVLFTFDRSASTRGETLTRLRESAGALLNALDVDDQAGLLAFNHMFQLAVKPGPPAAVRRALDQLEPEGSTAIFDATSTALALAAGSSRRTLILLFTDGVDTLSWLPERTVVEAARSSEAVLYAVALPEFVRNGQPLRGDDAPLRRMAEATGGRLLRADDPTHLRERFMEVLREMRSRYILTFTPYAANQPGWHALSVKLKTRKGKVAARAGYIGDGRP